MLYQLSVAVKSHLLSRVNSTWWDFVLQAEVSRLHPSVGPFFTPLYRVMWSEFK